MIEWDRKIETLYSDEEDEELKHYGVPGMKWGIRRYQPYPDGSSRKGRFTGKKKTRSKKKNAKKVKPASEMSDQELRQRINRIQMEKQYQSLTTPPNKTKSFVKKTVGVAATTVAMNASREIIEKGMKESVKIMEDKLKK